MNDHLLAAIAIAIVVFIAGRFLLARRDRIPGPKAHAEVEAGAALVDVRTPTEFASGSIPGAKNVPLATLEERVGELDPKRPVVVFCASGMRSARAAAILKRKGFTAYDLGPASAW